MNYKEMSAELEVGDIINGSHEVVKINLCHVVTRDGQKFCTNHNTSAKYTKIKTVSSNGVQWFELMSHGGYRHGIRGGKYKPKPLDPNRKCKYCGKVITDSRRRSFCNDICYNSFKKEENWRYR